jgi:molybdopterin-guanine dinucleotide biosynthesis adapter protein
MAASGKPLVIGVAGWKNSGKTTLAARLIGAFVARGLRVASLKHAHHSFQVDDADTDSAKHRRAGAQQVAVVSEHRWALIRELRTAPEPSLADMLGKLDPCDVVVVEGYKRAPIAKIEVRRAASATRTPLADDDPHVIAIAADHAVPQARVPVFGLDDIEALADLVLSRPRT